jgi:hypothetical protein
MRLGIPASLVRSTKIAIGDVTLLGISDPTAIILDHVTGSRETNSKAIANDIHDFDEEKCVVMGSAEKMPVGSIVSCSRPSKARQRVVHSSFGAIGRQTLKQFVVTVEHIIRMFHHNDTARQLL